MNDKNNGSNLFRITVFILVTSSILTLFFTVYIIYKSNLEYVLSLEGLFNIDEFLKTPAFIAKGGLSLCGILFLIHKINQTQIQIDTINKNIVNNDYYKHIELFRDYTNQQIENNHFKSKRLHSFKVLHDIYFPYAKSSNNFNAICIFDHETKNNLLRLLVKLNCFSEIDNLDDLESMKKHVLSEAVRFKNSLMGLYTYDKATIEHFDCQKTNVTSPTFEGKHSGYANYLDRENVEHVKLFYFNEILKSINHELEECSALTFFERKKHLENDYRIMSLLKSLNKKIEIKLISFCKCDSNNHKYFKLKKNLENLIDNIKSTE